MSTEPADATPAPRPDPSNAQTGPSRDTAPDDVAPAVIARLLRSGAAAARASGRAPGAAFGASRGVARPQPAPPPAGSAGSEGAARGPQRLGDVVAGLVGDRGWEENVQAAALHSRWESLVGSVAQHARPRALVDGVLTVDVDSTAWATQLRYLTDRMTAQINEGLGAPLVRRIEIKGPVAPSWSRGKLRVRGRGPRDTYG